MKNIFIVILLCFSFAIAKSQPVNFQSAYNYFGKKKYDKAKEAIDLAAQDSKTSTWFKTWFYRGQIYQNIYLSKDSLGKEADTTSLEIAFDSYNKATELDPKNEYKSDIKEALKACGAQFYNKGVIYLNKGKYLKALPYFEKSININVISENDDKDVLYYTGLCAEKGNKPNVAKKYYKKLYESGYENLALYIALQSIYKKDKDTAKALDVIQKAMDIYPDIVKKNVEPLEKANKPDKVAKMKASLEHQYLELLIEQTNIYLAKGKTAEAQKNLYKAIEKDSTNPNLYCVIGLNFNNMYDDTTKTVQEKLEAYAMAEKQYLKAIKLKPDYYDANYNLGALYYNEGVRLIKELDKIKDVDKYNAEKVKVEEYWKKSLPYLEKALQIQPNDINTLISLKSVYARTGQIDKFKETNKKIEELKQKK